MRTLGYSRVSTDTQCLDRQLIALTEQGIAPENIYDADFRFRNSASVCRKGVNNLGKYSRLSEPQRNHEAY